jgi:hypothetical protein
MIQYHLHILHYNHQVTRANHQSSPLAADKYTGCVRKDILYLNVNPVYKMIKYTPYKHTRRIQCACGRVYKYSLHLCNAEIVVGRGYVAASVCESIREISFYYIIILIYTRAHAALLPQRNELEFVVVFVQCTLYIIMYMYNSIYVLPLFSQSVIQALEVS